MPLQYAGREGNVQKVVLQVKRVPEESAGGNISDNGGDAVSAKDVEAGGENGEKVEAETEAEGEAEQESKADEDGPSKPHLRSIKVMLCCHEAEGTEHGDRDETATLLLTIPGSDNPVMMRASFLTPIVFKELTFADDADVTMSLSAPLGATVTFASSDLVMVSPFHAVYTGGGNTLALARGSFPGAAVAAWTVLTKQTFRFEAETEAEVEAGGDETEAKEATGAEGEENKSETKVADAQGKETETDTKVMKLAKASSTFSVSDSSLESYLTLYTMNNDTRESKMHGLLGFKDFDLDVNEKGYTIIVVCNNTGETALNRCDWELSVTSSSASLAVVNEAPNEELYGELAPLNQLLSEVGPGAAVKDQRFEGTYIPNKYLRLFRDVVALPPGCTGLTCRLWGKEKHEMRYVRHA